MIAMMLVNIQLLGTSLTLEKGQKITVVRATNQPNNQNKYFARPYDGKWKNGRFGADDSILIHEDDFEIIS